MIGSIIYANITLNSHIEGTAVIKIYASIVHFSKWRAKKYSFATWIIIGHTVTSANYIVCCIIISGSHYDSRYHISAKSILLNVQDIRNAEQLILWCCK